MSAQLDLLAESIAICDELAAEFPCAYCGEPSTHEDSKDRDVCDSCDDDGMSRDERDSFNSGQPIWGPL